MSSRLLFKKVVRKHGSAFSCIVPVAEIFDSVFLCCISLLVVKNAGSILSVMDGVQSGNHSDRVLLFRD